MATAPASSSPPVRRSAGRGLLFIGFALAVLAVVSLFVQWSLGITSVPWQMPAITAVGALLVVWSLTRRVTIVRVIVLLLLLALAGIEFFAISVGGKLPTYAGPAQAGQRLPPFQTTLADRSSFTDADLQDGRRRVMTFYRGRW